jgi:hypothetical protein
LPCGTVPAPQLRGAAAALAWEAWSPEQPLQPYELAAITTTNAKFFMRQYKRAAEVCQYFPLILIISYCSKKDIFQAE